VPRGIKGSHKPRRRFRNYWLVYLPKHHRAVHLGYVFEHIIVAEKKLGRKLRVGEVVHHLDHNGQNNNPNNLKVMTRSEHKKEHAEIGLRTRLKKIYEVKSLGPKALVAYKKTRNAKKAARVIGCSEMTLHRLIKSYLKINSLYEV